MLIAVAACGGDDSGRESEATGPTARELARLGGDATVADQSSRAFAQPAPALDTDERRAFAVGNSFFNQNWVTAPASTEGRDGLGPTFNAQSCSSCHFRDGRAQPTVDRDDPQLGLLVRISVPGTGADGGPGPHPVYGDQLQDRAVLGVPAEGTIGIRWVPRAGAFDDGTRYELVEPRLTIEDPAFGPLDPDVMLSARVAPAVIGVGLLEAIPEATILASADPHDADGDGISGRPNRVSDARTGETVLGRFGWKANVATVEQQNAAAFHGDIGITSSLFVDENCPDAQDACAAAPNGGRPELDDEKLERVTFYTRTLAVPARRDVEAPDARAGELLFDELGCASCHLPAVRTRASDVPALADQAIRPYTDLLLHDMGPGLADGRSDGEATGREWRTPPLWGIGLVETVNGHSRFLHDGRARSLEEAVLWHGGEADRAQARYRALPAVDRADLLRFLGSL